MTEQDKQNAFGAETESGRVSDAQHASQPAVKMTRKNKWIIVGVVAAVLVVAGAGFWVWHEQPSFCNAICHSPMDKYVETYYEGDPGTHRPLTLKRAMRASTVMRRKLPRRFPRLWHGFPTATP